MSQSNFELINMNMEIGHGRTDLEPYDHTRLSAVNTCPTWGILRYVLHKRMPGSNRAMALEAGAATHECFAAIRWHQFITKQATTPTLKTIAENHAHRLFGEDRHRKMVDAMSSTATDRTNCINVALEALYTSGFYDDIGDSRRTVSNISESVIAYIDRYDPDKYPIWIRDETDPDSDIGIEVPFDILVKLEWGEGNNKKEYFKKEYRFSGKLDGLHHYNGDKLIIIEEKTGARLDDSWLSQWILSHQITGYCLAATTFTDMPCNHALVSGTRIPIGKIPHEGIRKELVPRSPEMYEKWAEWLIHTEGIISKYEDHVLSAPMYTHSCNRYFRPCSFTAFCAADKEEKLAIIEEMEDDRWDVLAE